MRYKIFEILICLSIVIGVVAGADRAQLKKADTEYLELRQDVEKEHYISECSNVFVKPVTLKSVDYNEKVGQCSKLSTYSNFYNYVNCIENAKLQDELEKKYTREFFSSGKCVTVLFTGYEDTEINKVSSIDDSDKTWTIVKEIGNVGVNLKNNKDNAVMYIIEHKDNGKVPLEYNITYRTSDVSNYLERLKDIEVSKQFWSFGGRIK